MDIKAKIKSLINKTWSRAPSLASSELLSLYHTNPRLDGARVIAQKCAGIEINLYNKADYRENKNNAEKITEHDILDLLENPCANFRELTEWDLRYFVFACYALVGEAYLLKVRSPSGKVLALNPIAPSWVVTTPTVNANYWQIYPYGSTASNSIIVPANDVIVFKNIDLNDPYGRGRGTAESIGDEIQSDEYAAKFAKNLFYNDATPSAIIYAPQGNKETADQIKKSWMEKMAGLLHRHEPMVLTGEGSKFERISDTPQELDFVESRKFLRDQANQQFHIPPEIMGILENSNRSTIDASFYLLNKNVLSDYLRAYERVINTQLLWEDFDTERKLVLHHENTIEEDINQKLQIANEGLSRGALTVNDWRRAMGYEIDEKGGDVYLRSMAQMDIPFNSEPVELPETEESPEVTLPETEPKTVSIESIKDFEAMRKEWCKTHTVIEADEKEEKRRVAMWKTFDARARSIENPFVTQFTKALNAQKKVCAEAIGKACDENKNPLNAVEQIFNSQNDERLKQTMASAFKNGLEEGAKIGLERMGKKAYKDLESVNHAFNIWVDNYGLALCADMNATTKKKLRKVLAEAIEEGDSLENQKKKLIEESNGFFEETKKWRPMLVARTESCTTMNAGSTLLYKSEGVQNKMWIAARDDRTRESHMIIDGTVVDMGEKFDVPGFDSVEGAFMEYPGDATAPAGQVCNCRCTVAPFVRF